MPQFQFLYLREFKLRSLFIGAWFITTLTLFSIYYLDIFYILLESLLQRSTHTSNLIGGIVGMIGQHLMYTNLFELLSIVLFTSFILSTWITLPIIVWQLGLFLWPSFTAKGRWKAHITLGLFSLSYIFCILYYLYIILPIAWIFYHFDSSEFLFLQFRLISFVDFTLYHLYFSIVIFFLPFILYFFSIIYPGILTFLPLSAISIYFVITLLLLPIDPFNLVLALIPFLLLLETLSLLLFLDLII